MNENMVINTAVGEIKLPCMNPQIVDINKVMVNTYNPNHVSENNMELLLTSIKDNGFCFPVVVIYDETIDRYIVIDGFHRYLIFRDYLKADRIPVVVLDHTMKERMAATVQFNRARGVHQVELMGDLVQALIEQGAGDAEIAEHLGMDEEEARYQYGIQIVRTDELWWHKTVALSQPLVLRVVLKR